MSTDPKLIPAERIERRILLLRGQKVLLDFQLAELYEVGTKALNQAVKRNLERFPEDFMFQLSVEEMLEVALTPVLVVPWPVRLFSCGAAAGSSPRREPLAFTEHGVALLSGLLRGRHIARTTVSILRAFAQLTKQEQLDADAQTAMSEIRAWLGRDRPNVVEASRPRWSFPTVQHRGCAPRFQSRFANRKPKLS